MTLSVLDYILLAIIAAIIIHLLFQTFSAQEGMNSGSRVENKLYNAVTNNNSGSQIGVVSGSNEYDNNSYASIVSNQTNGLISLNSSNSSKGSNISGYTINGESEHSMSESSSVNKVRSIIDNNDQEVGMYIHDLLNGRRFGCDKKVNGTDEEEYLENFWGLRDNLNKDSNGGVDTVDKINELYVTDNNELTGNSGMRIGDLFDNLTRSNKNNAKNNDGVVCARSSNLCNPFNTTNGLNDIFASEEYSNFELNHKY